MSKEISLKCEHLTKTFKLSKGNLTKAVEDCNLTLFDNDRIGIAGNSGCGKSTLARLMAKLIQPTTGKVLYHHYDQTKVQLIFQHPVSALNPKHKIERALSEVTSRHQVIGSQQNILNVPYLFDLFNLSSELLNRYPHQISGGEAQRICLIRSLLVNPKVMVLDEATSMLDVLTQHQIIEALTYLQEQLKFALVFISHDLELLVHTCQTVHIMTKGKIVESVDAPLHHSFKSDIGQQMMQNYQFFGD